MGSSRWLIRVMATGAVVVAVVCMGFRLVAQTPPAAEDSDAMNAKAHALLARAIRINGLVATGAQPWHMKADYQLVQKGGYGALQQTGTIEEWWKGPDQWRRTYVVKGNTWTEWSVDAAHQFDTRGDFPHQVVDLRVGDPLVSPLAQAPNFKPEFPMEIHEVNVGIKVNCLAVSHAMHYSGGVDPNYLFPGYCFDSVGILRGMINPDTTVAYADFKAFQDHIVAYKADVIVNGVKQSTMTITTLEPLPASQEAMLQPDAKSVPMPFTPTAADPQPVPVYQDSAIYTANAVSALEKGTVSIPILIEKDGKVKLNGPYFGPPLLADPAADAVRRWRYAPYLVNGQPVEVAITVYYNFDGNPFVSQVPKDGTAQLSGYDPKRDPADDLKAAEAEAKQTHKRILLEVGGDWCIWCKYMDTFFDNHADIDALLKANYVVVKVNMSSANRNQSFLMQFPKFETYPHLLVLDADGKLLQSQDTGELERGSSYNPEKMKDFLNKWKAS